MPSPIVAIGEFCQSVAPIAHALFHSSLAVLQSILALSYEVIQNILPLERSFFKLASDLSQSLHESVLSNVGEKIPCRAVIHRPSAGPLLCTVNHWSPPADQATAPLLHAPPLHQSHEHRTLCNDQSALARAFERLAEGHSQSLDKLDEMHRVQVAQMQGFISLHLTETRLFAARTTLQGLVSNQTMARALLATSQKADSIWRKHDKEHSRLVEDARREVKALENELVDLQRSLAAPSGALLKLVRPQVSLRDLFSRSGLKRLSQVS